MENLNLTSSLVIASTVTVTAFIVHAYQKYQQNIRSLGNTPGIRTLVAVQRPIANLLPETEFPGPWKDWFFTASPGWWQAKGHKSKIFVLPGAISKFNVFEIKLKSNQSLNTLDRTLYHL
jgi:hypothetical protein